MHARISTPQSLALLAFVLLNALDAASTHMGLQMGLREGNLLPSLLLANGGSQLLYVFKALSALLIVLTVVRLGPRYQRIWYGIHLANGILLSVVLLNVVQMLVM